MSVSSARIVKKFLIVDPGSGYVISKCDTFDAAVSQIDLTYSGWGGPVPDLYFESIVEALEILPPTV